MLNHDSESPQHVIERMTDIVACLNSSSSIEKFLLDIHCILQKVTYADNFYVVLFDEDERLNFPYFHDVKDDINIDELQSIARESLDNTLTAFALSSHQVCNFNEHDIEHLIQSGQVKMLGSLPKQWLCFPLSHHNMHLGAFVIQSYRRQDEYNETIVEVLFTISHVISSALAAFKMQQELISSNLRLQNYQGELELRVKERTEQLEQTVNDLTKEISYREKLQKELEHESLHDSLTGLANRKFLFKKLDELEAKQQRATQNIILLCLDLDGFKQVNDTFGHPAGDVVLSTVSERIQQVIRPYDFAARVGGDEFIILFEQHLERDKIKTIAARIIDCICEPIKHAEKVMTVGASIGISSTEFNQIMPSELIHHADIALYKAKEQGKRQFCFYGE